MDQLKNVINDKAEDITPNDDAESLLAELNEPPVIESNQPDDDPTGVPPPAVGFDHPMDSIHSIPHNQSSPESDPHATPLEKSIPHESSPDEEAPHVYPDKSNTL
jgi:hypothetical protein